MHLANVSIALAKAYRKYGDPSVLTRTDSPMKGVFALKAFTKGELVLVPATTTMKLMDRSSDDKEKVGPFVCTGGSPSGNTDLVVELKAPSVAELAVPAWHIKPILDQNDRESANVHITTSTKVVVSASLGSDVHKHTIHVPVIVNRKNLAADEELRIFRPAQKQENKRKSFVILPAGSSEVGKKTKS